jgi:hypothetical protein
MLKIQGFKDSKIQNWGVLRLFKRMPGFCKISVKIMLWGQSIKNAIMALGNGRGRYTSTRRGLLWLINSNFDKYFL